MASVDRNRGYLTSSFTMLSNTSSSSSPGKGDYNENNLKNTINRLKITIENNINSAECFELDTLK